MDVATTTNVLRSLERDILVLLRFNMAVILKCNIAATIKNEYANIYSPYECG